MGIIEMEIVVWSIDIGRNDGSKLTSILGIVRSISYIQQSFGIGIRKIT